jgi:hypothetical protein
MAGVADAVAAAVAIPTKVVEEAATAATLLLTKAVAVVDAATKTCDPLDH